MRKDSFDRLKTVYIGGGTPTVLPLDSLERLFKKLSDIPWSKDIEITIEANPGTVEREKIRFIKGAGVNRVSLGIQSFIDRELTLLRRVHDSLEGLHALEILRDEGIKNISIDLIYGIPDQSIKDWQYNLSVAIGCSPEHISTYELTPEEGTPLFDLIRSARLERPEEDKIIDMYYHAIERLTTAGYRHYEISNFAKEGYQCRHNLNYWERGEYVGLGAGAHSFDNRVRRVNPGDVRRYIETLKRGSLVYDEEMVIPEKEALKESLFLGLRKREGIRIDLFKERFKLDIVSASSTLIKDGLLEVKEIFLRLTGRGIMVSNSVIVSLFEELGL